MRMSENKEVKSYEREYLKIVNKDDMSKGRIDKNTNNLTEKERFR